MDTSKLRNGDILLWDGDGFVSKVIKYITDSLWSHAAWIIHEQMVTVHNGCITAQITPQTGTWFVLEADWMGVVMRPLEYYFDRPNQVAVVRINQELISKANLQGAVEKAQEKLGKQYDFKLLLGLGWDWLWGRKRSKRTANTRSAYICSELVARPLHGQCFFMFHDDIAVSNIAPADIRTSKKVDLVFDRGRWVG